MRGDQGLSPSTVLSFLGQVPLPLLSVYPAAKREGGTSAWAPFLPHRCGVLWFSTQAGIFP